MPKQKNNSNIFIQFCKKQGLPAPIPEYKFSETRKWRIDYYFERNGVKLALEVEGGIWQYGRHNRASGFIKDMEKYNALATHGIWLIRVTPKELLSIDTINLICAVIKKDHSKLDSDA